MVGRAYCSAKRSTSPTRAEPEYDYAAKFFDTRTVLGLPLLREGVPIGVITICRDGSRTFYR